MAELDDFGGSDVEVCFVVVAIVSWALAFHLCLSFLLPRLVLNLHFFGARLEEAD